jgi:EAL domain-containing protein (putative c-di-GMP-specific phosphodiesterase class I)
MGCDELQGYLLSGPLPVSEIDRLFETTRGVEAIASAA